MRSKLKICLFVYFLILTGFCFVMYPFGDSFYYWNWGQHLGLSYLDGPPMIAYMMRLSSTIFGNTFFAINFVAVACAIATCYFIYNIGKLLLNKEVGLLAALLWLISPTVAQNIFARVTYDSAESLFWIATIYFAACYSQTKKTLDIYRIGIFVGLALLSKYSGVILALGLLIYFVMTKNLRDIFKNKHLYFAAILTLVIFSPVIIWNSENHWITVIFQLRQHSTAGSIKNVMTYTWRLFYCLNLLLVLPIIFAFKNKSSLFKESKIARLLIILSFVFIGFWFVMSYSANVKLNYFLPGALTLSLLTSYYLVQYRYKKIFLGMGILFVSLSLCFLLGATVFLNSYFSFEYPNYLLAKEAIDKYRIGNEPLISMGWNNISKVNFLLKHDDYGIQMTIPHYCDGYDAQYHFWGTDQPLQSALFIDFYDLGQCFKPYFKSCAPLPTLHSERENPLTHQMMASKVYAYQCSN